MWERIESSKETVLHWRKAREAFFSISKYRCRCLLCNDTNTIIMVGQQRKPIIEAKRPLWIWRADENTVEAALWRRDLNTRLWSSGSIQWARRSLLLLGQRHNVINTLLERDIIRAVCSVRKGKMILEALSVTRVGDDGTRPGMMAVGVKRKILNVETWMGFCHD